jgi:hypothetical protein
VQIGDNRAAEWVRRSNPVALGLLFSGLAGQNSTQKSIGEETLMPDGTFAQH